MELEDLLLENPDRPHRLRLASSDHVIVPNARAAIIEGMGLRVYDLPSPDRLIPRGSRLASIPDIVLADMIDRPFA